MNRYPVGFRAGRFLLVFHAISTQILKCCLCPIFRVYYLSQPFSIFFSNCDGVVWSNVGYPSCAACTCFTWEEFCFQSVFFWPRWLGGKKCSQKLIFLTWPSFSVSPLTDPVSVGAILFSALNCEQTYSIFPFSLIFSRRSYPVAVVGEADGDDDEDEDRDDGHHHHVGGEQSCQVIWCSAEKKTVNNMKSYTQQACNIQKSLSMNEKGKYKNKPKLHNITHTHSHTFLYCKRHNGSQ